MLYLPPPQWCCIGAAGEQGHCGDGGAVHPWLPGLPGSGLPAGEAGGRQATPAAPHAPGLCWFCWVILLHGCSHNLLFMSVTKQNNKTLRC